MHFSALQYKEKSFFGDIQNIICLQVHNAVLQTDFGLRTFFTVTILAQLKLFVSIERSKLFGSPRY